MFEMFATRIWLCILESVSLNSLKHVSITKANKIQHWSCIKVRSPLPQKYACSFRVAFQITWQSFAYVLHIFVQFWSSDSRPGNPVESLFDVVYKFLDCLEPDISRTPGQYHGLVECKACWIFIIFWWRCMVGHSCYWPAEAKIYSTRRSPWPGGATELRQGGIVEVWESREIVDGW